MKKYCINHPDKEAVSFCHNCNKYYCSECLNEGLSYYYCKNPECNEKYLEELHYLENPQFCNKCIQDTNTVTIGNLQTVNFIGTSYLPVGDRCDICGSYIVERTFVFLGLPIMRFNDTYRIIKLNTEESFFKGSFESFLSRKIK